MAGYGSGSYGSGSYGVLISADFLTGSIDIKIHKNSIAFQSRLKLLNFEYRLKELSFMDQAGSLSIEN